MTTDMISLNDPKAAVPAILGNKDMLSAILAALRKDGMVARLGDGEVFFLQEAGKTKRGFKVRVDLQFPVHFCFPAGPNSKSMITAEGFDRLNQFAGVEVFRPKTVVAQDGSERGNPYFERDPQTGAMLSVFMRGIGIGYAPTGNLTAVDQTVYVNLQTLLIQEIQAKIKRYPALGQLGAPDSKPAEITYYGDNGKWGRQRVIDSNPTTIKAVGAWHFLPLANGMGYWVNLSHPEIQAAFDSFTQKQRFLERTTFSILKRLILSSHPAIASKTPNVTELVPGEGYNEIKSAKAHIFVYGFKADDRSAEEKHRELQAMAERVAEGERLANMEVIQGAAHDAGAEDAEMSDPAAAGASPDELPPAPPPEDFGEAPPQTPPSAAKQALRFYVCESCKAIHTLSEPADVCENCGATSMREQPTLAAARAYVGAPKTPVVTAAKPSNGGNGNGNGNGDLRAKLQAVMQDKARHGALIAARNKMGFSSFSDLRKASDEKLVEFFAALEGGAQ